MTKLETQYDKETKRHTATCPVCGRTVIRSKREAATHNMLLHLIHTHDLDYYVA